MKERPIYRPLSARSAIQSVDFARVNGESYAFFQLKDGASVGAMKAQLAEGAGQRLVSVTQVDGKPMLITRSHDEPYAVLRALSAMGEPMKAHEATKPFNAWKVRSMLGFAGQSLQLVSSFMRPGGKLDTSIFVFATTNLAANTINLKYNHGEQMEDVHRLRHLKQAINRDLAPHVRAGEDLPGLEENQLAQRGEEATPTLIGGAKHFLKRHSVEIGELGLRYLGAASLAFPVQYWKKSISHGHMPPMDISGYRRYAGLSSLVGKTVALGSTVPDPYNPRPRSWIDAIREKYTFTAGSLIEITSFSALAYDAWFNTLGKHNKRALKLNHTIRRDCLGAMGASMFVMGYIVRLFAQFGERQVNMPELYAHATDALASVPHEKAPQLLADTAAKLAEHFKDNSQGTFAQIYAKMAEDMVRYHAEVPLVANSNEPLGASPVPGSKIQAEGAKAAPIKASARSVAA